MIQDLWHALLAAILRVLQRINNLHRQYGLWLLREHWKTSICAFLLLVVAIFGAGRLYGKLSRQRLLANATAALQHDDPRNAAFFAMKLLRVDPNNIAACRVMTEATDTNWPKDALAWHARIEKLIPGDTQNCLAWARAALRLPDGALARTILDKMRPEDMNLPEYQWLAGEAALSQKDVPEAATHLEKAAALSPGKVDYAFELAKVDLLLPGDARKRGQQQLEVLLGDPHLHLQVLRLLFRDAIRHLQVPRAFAYFAQLRKEPGVTSEDRMEYLNLLLRLRHPTLMPEVLDYQKTARTPEAVSSLVFWMDSNGMALVAVEWVIALPKDLQANNKVQLALAEAYVNLRDWTRLESLVNGKSWGELDFLRVALFARCLAEEGEDQKSQDQWKLAILKASDHPSQLATLCQTAIGWGWNWDTEAQDLAWRIVDGPNPPLAILNAMQSRFVTLGETQNFYRLLARWRELDPSDRAVQNNFALVSLLLKKNEGAARELAQEVYAAAPSDARVGSTYALSLYLQGQRTEALNVMSHFGTQLRIPSVALYNGVFLAACGEPSQARQYLQLAKRTQLLPEEQQLAAEAEASIGDPTPAPLTSGTAR